MNRAASLLAAALLDLDSQVSAYALAAICDLRLGPMLGGATRLESGTIWYDATASLEAQARAICSGIALECEPADAVARTRLRNALIRLCAWALPPLGFAAPQTVRVFHHGLIETP